MFFPLLLSFAILIGGCAESFASPEETPWKDPTPEAMDTIETTIDTMIENKHSFSVSEIDEEESDQDKKITAISDEMEEDPAPQHPDSDDTINAIIEGYNTSQTSEHYLPHAKLLALNKITARSTQMDASVGQSTYYGNLELFVKLCWQPPKGSSNQDSKALLEIWEHKPHQEKQRIYYAWMVANRPSLSPLEHAVYDITLKGCNHLQ